MFIEVVHSCRLNTDLHRSNYLTHMFDIPGGSDPDTQGAVMNAYLLRLFSLAVLMADRLTSGPKYFM